MNCCRLVIYLSKVCVTLKKLFISTLLPHPLYPDPIVNPPLVHTQLGKDWAPLRIFSTINFFYFTAVRLYIVCTFCTGRASMNLYRPRSPDELSLRFFLMACGIVFLYPSLKLISETSFTVNLMYLQSILVLNKYFINIFSYFYTVQQW